MQSLGTPAIGVQQPIRVDDRLLCSRPHPIAEVIGAEANRPFWFEIGVDGGCKQAPMVSR